MRALVLLFSILLLSGKAKESVVGVDVVGKAGEVAVLFGGGWKVLLLDEEGAGAGCGDAGLLSPFSCC